MMKNFVIKTPDAEIRTALQQKIDGLTKPLGSPRPSRRTGFADRVDTVDAYPRRSTGRTTSFLPAITGLPKRKSACRRKK